MLYYKKKIFHKIKTTDIFIKRYNNLNNPYNMYYHIDVQICTIFSSYSSFNFLKIITTFSTLIATITI